jgi:hypothetical protein
MATDRDGRPHRKHCVCVDCKTDRDRRYAAIVAEGERVPADPPKKPAPAAKKKQQLVPKPKPRPEARPQPAPQASLARVLTHLPDDYCSLCGLSRSHWAGCDGKAKRVHLGRAA